MGEKGKAIKALACWFWKPSQNLSNKGPNSNSVSVKFKKYTYIDIQGRLKSVMAWVPIDDKGYWDSGCSRHMTCNISYLSDYEPFDGGYVSFECIVLGRDYKLLDDANVLPRTPRFTWTFFLKTKDETSGILRKFITEIKNLKDLKVNIIRCDNRGEFRNKEMNNFCSQKGIKKEFSNAKTPQRNGVAERRNRTLIETARTMLADAKLP
nr:putative ribonuclease H-like domain-containing protein [Tanacetum cinerariifolium]